MQKELAPGAWVVNPDFNFPVVFGEVLCWRGWDRTAWELAKEQRVAWSLACSHVLSSQQLYKLSMAGGPHEQCSCILQSFLMNKAIIFRRFKIALLLLVFLAPPEFRAAPMLSSLATSRGFVGCHH